MSFDYKASFISCERHVQIYFFRETQHVTASLELE